MNKVRLALLLLVPVVAGAFYLRSLSSWRPRRVFAAPGKIWQLAFSSDGKTLLVAHGVPDPSISLVVGNPSPDPPTVIAALDVGKGFKPLWEHRDARSFIGFQFFDHNSQILKQGSGIQLLDARTGKTRRDYGRLAGSATASPDGKWLAYNRLNIAHWWQRDGRIYLNPANAARQGKNIRADKVIGQKSDTVDAFGFSPDGKIFAVGVGGKNGARLDFYSTTTWKLTHSWTDLQRKFSGRYFLVPPSIQWKRDGRFLLPSWTYPEGLRVCRISKGKQLASSSLRYTHPLPPHLELEDRGRVLSYGDGGQVLLNNPITLKTDFETLLDLHHEKVTAVTLSPDGSFFVAGTASGNVFSQRVK